MERSRDGYVVHYLFQEAELLQNEIDILKDLRHERIVSFHESQRKAEQLYLFMDYMPEVRDQEEFFVRFNVNRKDIKMFWHTCQKNIAMITSYN